MQPNNCSRRYFFRNTSLAATGLFLLPRPLFSKEFLNPAGQTAAPFATNPVQIENAKPGTTAWQLSNPAINREVEGYASLTSVNRGGQISFCISVDQGQQVDVD